MRKNKKSSGKQRFPGRFFPDGKKGVELSLNTVVIAIILLIALAVIVTVFIRLFGQEAVQIKDQISSLGDEDGDGVINTFDKCPCICGERDYGGCINQAALDASKEREKPKTCEGILQSC